MLHLLMLAMSPLVPVPEIAAPESINHGWTCVDAVAVKTGGAWNIPRGFVGVSAIGPGSSDKSRLRLGLGLGSVSISEVLVLISMSLSDLISGSPEELLALSFLLLLSYI